MKTHEYKGKRLGVTPDIIVHKRVTGLNVLAVETKVTTNSNKQKRSDAERLRYFTTDCKFNYVSGLSLTFETRKEILLTTKKLTVKGYWFKAYENDGEPATWSFPMDEWLLKCTKERAGK